MFLVSYNLYPGLIQDDLGGPPALESIQSDPALADQSGAETYEPGLRFIQEPIYRHPGTVNALHYGLLTKLYFVKNKYIL